MKIVFTSHEMKSIKFLESHVSKILLATGVANNVCLTTMGTIQFSMEAVYLVIIQKNRLTRDER